MFELVQSIFSEFLGEILITVSGGVVYFIKHVRSHKTVTTLGHKLDQATNELMSRRAALGFSKYTSDWNEFLKDLELLGKTSIMDRFLILNAWNGNLNPERTTAVFQRHFGDHPTTDYIGVGVDEFYNQMLRHIEVAGFGRYKTSELKGDLKDYYEYEGVTESVIFFIEAKSYEGGGRSVGYCSFATHDVNGFTDADVGRCRAMVGRLKMLALSFDETNYLREPTRH